MYLAHFGFTHYPFERALQPDELFASSAAREAQARLASPGRVARHRPDHRRGRLGQDHAVPATVRRPASGPLPPVLRAAVHRQRARHVQGHRLAAGPAHRAQPRQRLPRHPHRSLAPDLGDQDPPACSSSTRRSTCATMCSRTCACSPTTPWTPSGACACSWSGFTELRRRLTMAVHESLTQRIVVRYHLSGLTREELPAYLTHRLQLAGCTLPLFEPAGHRGAVPGHPGLAAQGQPRRPLRAVRRRAGQAPTDQRRARPVRPRGGPAMKPVAAHAPAVALTSAHDHANARPPSCPSSCRASPTRPPHSSSRCSTRSSHGIEHHYAEQAHRYHKRQQEIRLRSTITALRPDRSSVLIQPARPDSTGPRIRLPHCFTLQHCFTR